MKTVQELIDELVKVEDKSMEVRMRNSWIITDVTDVFEAESDGIPFICIDTE